MSTCDGCERLYMQNIKQFYGDNEESLNFLRDHGVLPKHVVCPRCGRNCTFRKDKNTWRCSGSFKFTKSKKRRRCGFSSTENASTFLSKSHLPPWKVILFVNEFLRRGLSLNFLAKNLNISKSTVSEWRQFCCEVTEAWCKNQDPIGGDDVIIEISEIAIFHENKRRGREQIKRWAFAGIERVSKRMFIVPSTVSAEEDRSEETLWPLLRKHVRPGSIIYSSPSRGYQGISFLMVLVADARKLQCPYRNDPANF